MHAPLARFISAFAGIFLLVVGFLFSLAALAVASSLALVVWLWFWWRTRALRSHRFDMPSNGAGPTGEVIEGEAVVVEETFTRATSNRLPKSPDRR